ncbi:hypothetical protein ACF0H5_006428 [Mactra antiquata]
MLTDHKWGLCLAVIAGTMAALASISAKLAVTADIVHDLCLQFSQEINIFCDSISLLVRCLCVGGIFLFNALMWTFYTKSLQFCPSTVEATITNTGANFIVSAIFGLTIFGEKLSFQWWIGSCLILVGLMLINQGSQETDKYEESKKIK